MYFGGGDCLEVAFAPMTVDTVHADAGYHGLEQGLVRVFRYHRLTILSWRCMHMIV